MIVDKKHDDKVRIPDQALGWKRKDLYQEQTLSSNILINSNWVWREQIVSIEEHRKIFKQSTGPPSRRVNRLRTLKLSEGNSLQVLKNRRHMI